MTWTGLQCVVVFSDHTHLLLTSTEFLFLEYFLFHLVAFDLKNVYKIFHILAAIKIWLDVRYSTFNIQILNVEYRISN